MAASLPPFPTFNVHDEGSTSVRWKRWKERLDNLLVALDIKDVARKKALLLHYAGDEVHDIFSTLTLAPIVAVNDAPPDVYTQATTALEKYFIPKRNKEYDVYQFRQAKQKVGENVTTYNTRLRKLAEYCEFADIEAEIKSQIVQSCSSARLRRRALRDGDMTLENLLTLARAFELSDQQAQDIEGSKPEEVNFMKNKSRGRGKTRGKGREKNPEGPATSNSQKTYKPQAQQNKTCYRCGGTFPHKSKPCPAKGQKCTVCSKIGHFGKMCRSKDYKARAVTGDDTSSDDDGYTFMATTKSRKSQPNTAVSINGNMVDIIVDTGATINILDQQSYKKITPRPKVMTTKTKIFPYGNGDSIDIQGTFEATFEWHGQETTGKIFVVKGQFGSLLSYTTAVELGIIPVIRVVEPNLSEPDILEQYSDRFEGIGCIKGVQAKIHIDESVQPVAQQHRRIPFHMRKKVEAELERLEELDIIEKVDGPTPWVSPIVVAPKPKNPEEIRICIDMRLPNEAVERERHITPTIDDILVDLNGACVFSKLDLNAGYHQVELAPESRYITTFTTHVGLRRYKRLIFGISSASEKFQAIVGDCLEGLEGVKNISDDIIVFAKDQKSHDERLHKVFQRLREKNITLNKSKCEFSKNEVEFFGYVFSKKGVSPDPKKVDAIKDAAAPTNPGEIRSFLGLANYVSRFIPDFATLTAPLRALTHKNSTWKWTKVEQESFDRLKTGLTTEAMAYFDTSKPTEVHVDASPVGLGGILVQEGKIIQYASKALSDVEKRYSQTEKEALAIVWGCEHFHLYLCGSPFVLHTDHKPLEVIFNNPKSKPPARIERWRLRLQPYDFTVKYAPGKTNPADFMSRHPVNSTKTLRHSKVAEEYLNFIVQHSVPKAMDLEQIARETAKDAVLQEVIGRVLSGKWKEPMEHDMSKPFVRIIQDLTVAPTAEGSVLLHQNRLVLPASLQQAAVNLAHEGHLGIVKTKQLLREKVWFPGINSLVEATCKSCVPCLAATPTTNKEPLHMTKLPDQPWTHLSCDFCGPFPSGDYLLVVIDDYSRFPIVDILRSTSARSVIPRLDKIFSEYGIPEELKTDNGPPFQSSDFRDFAENFGFHHRKITPLWPKANGEAERFMRTLGKTIRASTAENLSWKQELYKFLRNYRATPHNTTKIAPAMALLNRNIKTKLPEYTTKQSKRRDIEVVDNESKQRMKNYADSKNHAKESQLELGDHVLVKTERRNKLSTPFSPVKYEIVKTKGSLVTAKRGSHLITRNSSFFKKVGEENGPIEVEEEPIDPDLDEIVLSDNGGSPIAPNDERLPNPLADVPKRTSTPMKRPVREKKAPVRMKDYVVYR